MGTPIYLHECCSDLLWFKDQNLERILVCSNFLNIWLKSRQYWGWPLCSAWLCILYGCRPLSVSFEKKTQIDSSRVVNTHVFVASGHIWKCSQEMGLWTRPWLVLLGQHLSANEQINWHMETPIFLTSLDSLRKKPWQSRTTSTDLKLSVGNQECSSNV